MNYIELFNSMHPDFFLEKSIQAMPDDWVFTELVMNLRKDLPNVTLPHCPDGITFGEYHGELAALRDAVQQVDEDWVQYFTEGCRYYCAFDGERIVAFCSLADMGIFQGVHIHASGTLVYENWISAGSSVEQRRGPSRQRKGQVLIGGYTQLLICRISTEVVWSIKSEP